MDGELWKLGGTVLLCVVGVLVAITVTLQIGLFLITAVERWIWPSWRRVHRGFGIDPVIPRPPPSEHSHLVGLRVVTGSPLKPHGHVLIDGRRYQARSLGDYIPANEPVDIIRAEGRDLVVQQPGERDGGNS